MSDINKMSDINNLCIKITDDEEKELNTNITLKRSGGNGTVYTGTIPNILHNKLKKNQKIFGKIIAMKKININKFDMNEIELLMKTEDLKFSIKYHCCLFTNQHGYIIMDYFDGIELVEYINKQEDYLFDNIQNGILDENTNTEQYLVKVYMIIIQLALAIKELHENGIYHNDIKPDNIMVVKEDNVFLEIKLIDYGAGCNFNTNVETQKNCRLSAGTPGYRIEEFIRNVRNNNNEYKEKIGKKDWWAFGCVLYCLLFKSVVNDPHKLKYINIFIKSLQKLNSDVALIFYTILYALIIDKENSILNNNISSNSIQEYIFRQLDFTEYDLYIKEKEEEQKTQKNKNRTSYSVQQKPNFAGQQPDFTDPTTEDTTYSGNFHGARQQGNFYYTYGASSSDNKFGGGIKRYQKQKQKQTKSKLKSKTKTKLKSKLKLKLKLKLKSKKNQYNTQAHKII